MVLQALSCSKLQSQAPAEEGSRPAHTDLSLLMSFSPSLGWPTSKAWPPRTRQAAVPRGQVRSCGLGYRRESVKHYTGCGLCIRKGHHTYPRAQDPCEEKNRTNISKVFLSNIR